MKKLTIFVTFFLLLAAVGCGGGGGAEPAAQSQPGAASADAASANRLSADFASDALSVQAQLALGTVQLEGTDLAVNEAQAKELLPLWRALQSLGNSSSTAEAELTAVVNQLQDSMTAEQIQAIAAMELTDSSLSTMRENGELSFGRGGGGQGTTGGNGNGGGFDGPPPGGFGGPPPGGFDGGGPRGGFGGGFGGGNLSEDDIATRRAEFTANGGAANGGGNFADRAMMGLVIRLLEDKTGEVSANNPRALFDLVAKTVTEETGLTLEEIQAQTADGATLAEVIEANGGDVTTVRGKLVQVFSDLPDAANMDAEAMADRWLGLADNPPQP